MGHFRKEKNMENVKLFWIIVNTGTGNCSNRPLLWDRHVHTRTGNWYEKITRTNFSMLFSRTRNRCLEKCVTNAVPILFSWLEVLHLKNYKI